MSHRLLGKSGSLWEQSEVLNSKALVHVAREKSEVIIARLIILGQQQPHFSMKHRLSQWTKIAGPSAYEEGR